MSPAILPSSLTGTLPALVPQSGVLYGSAR